MIPEALHQQVFDQARKGKRFEIMINKVPGNFKYNSYVLRQGYITNLLLDRNSRRVRITHACVKLRYDGLGRAQQYTFPIEHITLVNHNHREEKTVSQYEEEPQSPFIHGQTPTNSEDLGEWNADPETDDEYDAYPDEPDYSKDYA